VVQVHKDQGRKAKARLWMESSSFASTTPENSAGATAWCQLSSAQSGDAKRLVNRLAARKFDHGEGRTFAAARARTLSWRRLRSQVESPLRVGINPNRSISRCICVSAICVSAICGLSRLR